MNRAHYLIQRLSCGDQLYLVPKDILLGLDIPGIEIPNPIINSELLGQFLDEHPEYLFGNGSNLFMNDPPPVERIQMPNECYFFALID